MVHLRVELQPAALAAPVVAQPDRHPGRPRPRISCGSSLSSSNVSSSPSPEADHLLSGRGRSPTAGARAAPSRCRGRSAGRRPRSRAGCRRVMNNPSVLSTFSWDTTRAVCLSVAREVRPVHRWAHTGAPDPRSAHHERPACDKWRPDGRRGPAGALQCPRGHAGERRHPAATAPDRRCRRGRLGGCVEHGGWRRCARRGESPKKILSTLATAESFGVTFLTEAVRRRARAPRPPPSSTRCGPRTPRSTTTSSRCASSAAVSSRCRFWIPDAAFGGGGVGLFESIETADTVELMGYLTGVTAFAQARPRARRRAAWPRAARSSPSTARSRASPRRRSAARSRSRSTAVSRPGAYGPSRG